MHHYDSKTPRTVRGQRGPSKLDDLSWLGRDAGEQMVGIKVLLLLALTVIPAAVVTLSEKTQQMVLQWQLMVPADQAVLSLPVVNLGLDWQRLAVVSLLGVAVLALLIGYAPTAEDRSE